MKNVSQGNLCGREEELACRSVSESFNDRRELFDSKGCIRCEGFSGRETRKMMRVRKRLNAFNEAFIGKLGNVPSTAKRGRGRLAPYLSIPNLGVTHPEKLVSSK